MRVTLFGTRGSLPSPGPDTARYGGNTSTVEVRARDGAVLVLDAGTGIRRLGAQMPPDLARVDVLLTHLHMDHIQGLGFFRPLYDRAIDVHIWGPAGGAMTLSERLSRYLSPPLFPVRLRDLPCVTCHEIAAPEFAVGGFAIRAAQVCHPNPTLGYRIEAGGRVLAYIPDHEPFLGLGSTPADPAWSSGYDIAAGAGLLIHDAQFTDEEYANCVGFGHSTYAHALAFAAQTGVKAFVPFHHDPWHDDATLDRLLEDTRRSGSSDMRVCGGLEGAVFEVE